MKQPLKLCILCISSIVDSFLLLFIFTLLKFVVEIFSRSFQIFFVEFLAISRIFSLSNKLKLILVMKAKIVISLIKKTTYQTVVIFGCGVIKFPERRPRLSGQEP